MSAVGGFQLGFAQGSWGVPLAGLVVVAVIVSVALLAWRKPKINTDKSILSYAMFFYTNFLKSHSTTADGGQQSALESFYSVQVFLAVTCLLEAIRHTDSLIMPIR